MKLRSTVVRMFISLFCLAMLGLTACASVGPLPGSLYGNVTSAVAATAQVAMKEGEACASSVLGIIATGDASIETARKNGGITSIASVDRRDTNILGLFMKHCTIVRGK